VGVLRPVRMSRIGILGLKDDRERILTALHDLRVAQIEPIQPEALAQLAPERGGDVQRRIGDETLRFRGLMAALPNLPAPAPRRFDTLDEILAAAATVPIDAEVGDLRREDDRLLTEERALTETLDLLGRLSFYPDRLDAIRSKSVLTFFGDADPEAFAGFRAGLDAAADPVVVTGPAADEAIPFLVAVRSSGGDALARAAQRSGVHLVALPNLAGTPTEETQRVGHRRAEVIRRRAEIAARLAALSVEWHGLVAAIDEALLIENRKVEALQKLGAGRSTFAMEAWVPQRDLARLQQVLQGVARDRVYLYEIPTHEEPPTLMDNPRGVRRFEFFIRFYSLPQATEWDPTLVFAIVFPIFFGFMLGDWGYGIVILLICLWMIAGFPGGQHLPKFGRTFVTRIMGPKGMQQLAYALLPGCALAIGLGLFWDEFFGYHLLAATIGYHAPIEPDTGLGLLLLVAGYIGLAMVTLGFLFGLLKEYFHHHRKGAIGKLGGILFAWGVAFAGLSLLRKEAGLSNPFFDLYIGLALGGFALLFAGEGPMGIMSLIEVVSHILSYTRLVGILLASVILALVINTVAGGFFHSGPGGIAAAVLLLLVGQSFNVILGVFEPGIQGARLVFVEYFSKFYTGNGRPFRAFGGPRERTVSSLTPPDGTRVPILGNAGAGPSAGPGGR
jgi:V/A-type H+/Na+-transporting ATPase subunit I